MKKFLLFCMVLLVSACGSDIDGRYEWKGQFGLTHSLVFKGNKVTIDEKVEYPYKLDGNMVKAEVSNGVFQTLGNLKKDGSIEWGGATYNKQK